MGIVPAEVELPLNSSSEMSLIPNTIFSHMVCPVALNLLSRGFGWESWRGTKQTLGSNYYFVQVGSLGLSLRGSQAAQSSSKPKTIIWCFPPVHEGVISNMAHKSPGSTSDLPLFQQNFGGGFASPRYWVTFSHLLSYFFSKE